MAHGFLTPEPVSGDNFWSNAKDLWNLLKKLKKEKAPPEKVVPAVVSELQNALPAGKQNLLSSGKQAAADKPKALNMLNGSPVSKMLGSGKTEITIKQQLALPPGEPKLSPGASPSGKGGTFTNLPGISAAPKKLDTDAFFKAAQTGVHPETGQYLNSDERKEYLKKSKATMNAPASVAAAGASGISSIGEVTKGDEAIIGAVTELTHVVTSLVDAVKSQTTSQQKIADREKTTADRLANRSLAAAEEKSLEQTKQSSGTLTPTGGIGGMSLGGGKSSGGFGGPGLGIGGKVLAKAVGKRGVGRVGTRLAAKYGGKVAAKAVGKFGAKQAEKLGVKAVGGTAAKILGKKIPLIGLGLGSIFAVQRALKGDWLGAGLELASGAASTVPGLGTAGSIGLDAVLAARDMGATPFAKGGIVTQPTTGLVGEAGKEGIFPLQGREGKKTFEMFGQGLFDAQKKNKREYANIQAAGLRQYYENQGGIEAFAKGLVDVFKGLGGALARLFGGPANAAENPTGAADYLNTGGLASFIGGVESGNDYTKLVGGAQDPNIMNKTVTQLSSEKGDKFAMGRYQIQMATAKGILAKKGIDPSKFKFDQAGQDQLFKMLLENRGLNDFMSGKMTKEQFAKNLSMEWAALPKDAGGQSYYAGVGGNKAHRGWGETLSQLDALKQSGSELGGSGGSSALAQAAASMKGMSSRSGPSGGKEACVWAVNKVFSKAGITPPWGSAEYVPKAEEMMIKSGYQQVSSPQPGDLYVAPGQKHIGVITPDGKVISNSSSGAQFTWVDTVAGYNDYYGGKGKIYRMPGNVASRAGKPTGSPTPTAAKPSKPAAKKSDIFAATPANANTGTGMMATSAQVSLGAMGLSTVGGGNITNIYNSNGQQVNPIGNGLTAGASSSGMGLPWIALIRK